MKWISLVAVLSASAATAQQSQLLTLAEALRIGRENSKPLQVSELRAGAAAARAGEMNASLLPSLKLEGGYRRLSNVDPFAVRVPFYPTPIVISPTVLNNYNVKVSLLQPLFTGFRLRSLARSAVFLSDASLDDNRADAQNLTVNITSAYWSLYQAIQTKASVDENVQRLELDRKDAEHLMNAGLATRNDLLRVEVQLSNAKLAQIDIGNDVQVAMMTLNNVLGQPLDTEVRPASVPEALKGGNEDNTSRPDTAASLKQLFQRALDERPDIRAMDLRVQSAQEGLSAVRGGYWPQILLTADYYYSRPNVRYQPTVDAFRSSWDVGIALQFDLWSWGTTSYQSDQAASALRQSELLYAQMKDNIMLEVKRAFLAVRRAHDKIGVARLAVAQADESVRNTKEKFDVGLATSSDLLDAETALLNAKTGFTGACVEQEISRAQLEKALGVGQ
jgi:outer membrane protein